MNETFDIQAYMTKGVERTEPVKQLTEDMAEKSYRRVLEVYDFKFRKRG